MPEKQPCCELSKPDKKVLAVANIAAKLFSTKGCIETSMEDTAAASKIGKGRIYYYNNKRDILNHILSTFMDLVLENVEQDLQPISRSLRYYGGKQ